MSSTKTVYIRFYALVDTNSINALLSTVEQKLKEGVKRFVILISSTGGNVFHGISAYNFLKGIPAEVITHNFGTVDSIALVLFCAGSKRYSVPHGRFLMHPVVSNFPAGAGLEEKQLEERLKGLRIDTENIAGVISTAIKKSEKEIIDAMNERTTIDPETALKDGIVHEIKEQLIEEHAELISITSPQ